MEEKRQNDLEEIKLFHAVFKMSMATLITFISTISLCVAGAIISLIQGIKDKKKAENSWRYDAKKTPWVILSICVALAVIFAIALLINLLLIKKNSCVVTNKRIFGIRCKGLVLKTFSFRLDKVDQAEAISCLGMRRVRFGFSKGSVGINPIYYQTPKLEHFTISNVYNHIEFYENLSKLIVSVKNDADVVVGLANTYSK